MICNANDPAGNGAVRVEFNHEISAVEASGAPGEFFISPGFIDIQVSGFAGADYNSPSTPPEEIARSIGVMHRTGMTRFYPTVVTGAPGDMTGALRNLSRAKDTLPECEAIEGFHVEGPHISPEDGPRGAHLQRWVRPPDFDEFRRWQDACDGRVRLVTLSPEWPEACTYIERVAAGGVVVSIGHTKANAAQIADAVRAGATFSTHLGNGAHSLLPRHPNYIWDQMADDRLTAGFIADGIHLPAAFLKVAFRAKGVERCVLVTDASTPAACPPGRYVLGEQAVELSADQRVTLAGTGQLAGSALRMDRGVENLIRLAGLGLTDALRAATVNPARACRIPGRQQGLAPGDRADFVLFRFDPLAAAIEVAETWVGGRRVSW
jgi:N-acetylglucosamine-6-phosphate deacetylase